MSFAEQTAERSRRGFPWLALGAGLVAFAMLIGLGTWQVERLAWKEGLIAAIDARTNSPPRPLSEIEDRYAEDHDVDYWPVTATGRFLNDKESHFLATWKGTSGFFVYTPLALEDGRVVLVNRGFVPYDRKATDSRSQGLIAGTDTVEGLARNRLDAKPSSLVPDNDVAKNIFYWKDLAAMAARAGVAQDRLIPFFIDAGPAPNPGGLPVGGVTLIDLPNNHLQYAVTWYGLAAALLAVFGVWLRARLREQ